MRFTERNIAVLSTLDPVARDVLTAFLQYLENNGEDVLLTAGFRTFAEQAALFEQGRTKPGSIVTYAKAGESYHNYGCAIDFVPITNGREDWKDLGRFVSIGSKAKAFGCEWGGDWTKPDLPHIQYTQGLTIAKMRAGKRGLRRFNCSIGG